MIRKKASKLQMGIHGSGLASRVGKTSLIPSNKEFRFFFLNLSRNQMCT
jgi:hypothetical protein